MTFAGYNSIARRVENEQGRKLKTVPIPRPEYKGPWDTVICDESHALVNTKADWTQATAKIQSDRLYLATGTPIPNWAHELLQPLRMLFPGDKRFTNKRRWQARWFELWTPPWGGPPKPQITHPEEYDWKSFWLGNGLDGPDSRMLMRQLDLGVPFTEQDMWVDMVPAQAKFYKELKKQYVAWMPSGEEVSAWSDGGLHTKLMQASTGLEILDEGSHGSGKFDVVENLLEDGRGQSTLLFCQFRRTAASLGKLAEDLGFRVGIIHGGVANADRDSIRRNFQNGNLDILVGTLGTLAVGVTLDRASTEIFVEHSWSPWRNDQALKRAMVLGKMSPVHVIHLWTNKSVDGGMSTHIGSKTEQQIRAFSARQFLEVIDG
jgi:SNF2 family DNA or RNA helicase